jgi:hypothetical protein
MTQAERDRDMRKQGWFKLMSQPAPKPPTKRQIKDRRAAQIAWDAQADEAIESCKRFSGGKCHNAQHGSYGHECGKPATWIASRPAKAIPGLDYYPAPGTLFETGFCDECKEHGDERHGFTNWRKISA